jgi:putative peptidoglycan lipid II flippase
MFGQRSAVDDLQTGAVPPDLLLGGRYRLVSERSAGGHGALWQAHDEVLARSVAVRLIPLPTGPTEPPAPAVRSAAGAAARVQHPGVARLLDRGESADPPVSWLVWEWVDGAALSVLLRDGPVSNAQAAELGQQVAAALAAAHEAGVAHGRLHPDNVLVRPDGRAVLTDLAVAAAVAGRTPAPADDLAGLGRLLYAASTARWPDGSAGGLPAAPLAWGQLSAPRQVRAGVSRPVELVIGRLLGDESAGPALTSAARAVDDLAGLPRAPLPTPEQPDESLPLGPAGRPLALRVLPWAALLIVALVGYLIGTSLAGSGRDGARFPSFAGGGHARRLVQLHPVGATDFNPEGTGPENPTLAPLALAGNPRVGWQTEYYQGSPYFGGLKSGVGLLVDLGRPQLVRQLTFRLTRPGAALQVRAGDALPAAAGDLTVVGSVGNAGQQVTLTLTGVRARYWLIWLTRLPPVGNGTYQVGVADLRLFG